MGIESKLLLSFHLWISTSKELLLDTKSLDAERHDRNSRRCLALLAA